MKQNQPENSSESPLLFIATKYRFKNVLSKIISNTISLWSKIQFKMIIRDFPRFPLISILSKTLSLLSRKGFSILKIYQMKRPGDGKPFSLYLMEIPKNVTSWEIFKIFNLQFTREIFVRSRKLHNAIVARSFSM